MAATMIASLGIENHLPGTTFGPRLLDDHDFLLVFSGSARWICDGVIHTLAAGDLLLARPGMRDQLHWDRQVPTRVMYLHFTPAAQGDLPPPAAWPLLRSLPGHDVVRPLLLHIAWLWEERPAGWRRRAGQALEVALAAFVSGQAATVAAAAPLSPVQEGLADLLARRWTLDAMPAVGLAELARAAGVSREHLCRTVRAGLGTSPMAVLRQLRVLRAASILGSVELPIAAIAAQCGFDDQLHFSRVFRQVWGVSPSAYRAGLVGGTVRPFTGHPAVNQLYHAVLDRLAVSERRQRQPLGMEPAVPIPQAGGRPS